MLCCTLLEFYFHLCYLKLLHFTFWNLVTPASCHFTQKKGARPHGRESTTTHKRWVRTQHHHDRGEGQAAALKGKGWVSRATQKEKETAAPRKGGKEGSTTQKRRKRPSSTTQQGAKEKPQPTKRRRCSSTTAERDKDTAPQKHNMRKRRRDRHFTFTVVCLLDFNLIAVHLIYFTSFSF